MENIELAYALTNQYLFQEAKNNITDISYYFALNPSTSGNQLIEGIVNAVKEYDLAAMDLPLFQSIIAKSGKTPDESNKILNDIRRWKSYSKDQIEPARKYLQDIVANVVIQKASRMYQDHPSDYLKYLKGVNFQTADANVLKFTDFNKVDINSIVAGSDEGIPSRFEWINQAFQPACKYPLGSIVVYCSVPGTGKSLWSLSEALNMATMGYKVHVLNMGDLVEAQVVARAAAIYSGLPFADAKVNLPTIYNMMTQSIGDNLMLTSVPSDSITIEEYIDFIDQIDEDLIKKGQPKLSCLILDYDSGFKMLSSNNLDNMYNQFGELYNKITELSIARNKLVILLSQPKTSAYEKEELSIVDIGESSRK